MSTRNDGAGCGCLTIGGLLAAICSIYTNGPSLWLLLHIPLGGFYVLYWIVAYGCGR